MLALVATGFAACSDNDFEPGPGVDGPQVYFPETIPSELNIDEDDTSVSIPVKRISTEGSVNIPILSDDASGLFNIPSTVNFAAGQSTTELVITFDKTQIKSDEEYPISLLLNDEVNTTPYGNRSLHVTIAVWPWKPIEANDSKGKYRDDFLTTIWTVEPTEVEVNIYEHKSKPGVYLVEEMFGETLLTTAFEAPLEDLSALLTYKPANITIDASDPNDVFIPMQESGVIANSNSYGKLSIGTFQSGSLVDGVITFPANGLGMNIENLHEPGKATQTNRSGMFRIILPGYEAVDYTLAAAYDGMKVSADGETASAVIDFVYGDNVTGISYVFASGDVTGKAAEYAAKIADGTAENIMKVNDFVAGEGKVSIEAELSDAGSYTLIAVPHDKDEKPYTKEVAATTFYFPGLGGSSAPDCDIQVKMGLVSVEWPEMSSQCPDESSLYFEITGSELESLYTLLLPTTAFEDYLAQGSSEQDCIDALGIDRSTSYMPNVNTKGIFGSAWINLTQDTEYTMLVGAKNIYGKKAVVSTSLSTKAIAYSGELVVGLYQMSYSEPNGYHCEDIFKVHPTANSTTNFFVTGLGYTVSNVEWYATYDSAAGTLTLDGRAKGYEQHGSVLGRLNEGLDLDETLVYRLMSYVDPESDAVADPIVFTVDAQTKQLNQNRDTYLHCPVFFADKTYAEIDLCYFPPKTPVTRYTATNASVFTAKRQLGRSVNIPFSSVRVPAANKLVTYKATAGKYTSDRNSRNDGIRTLSVKSRKCEPLPKQRGVRSSIDGTIIEAMK